MLGVLFCGFAAAVSIGGENWGRKASELDGLSITTVGGGDQPVRYQLVDRVTTETVATEDSLAAAVVAGYREQARRLQEERTTVQDRIDRLKAQEPVRTAANKADRAAMDARIAIQRADYERLVEEVNAAVAEGTELVRRAGQIRAEAATRGEDADRLQSELDAIRADAYRIEKQIAALKDRQVRLAGALARAERRRDQLSDRLQ